MKQNLTKYAGNTNSYNNNQEFLQKLKALAPSAVTADGQLNVSALKKILGNSEANDDLNEKFGLNWAGKHKIYGQIRQATTDTLKPNYKNSVDFNKTQNMFIEGDNLSALKILERSYFNKVKMIYIDPPYNTGNDFVYNDDFKTAQAEHEQQAGTHNDQGKVKRADGLTKNSKDKGRYHSNWLNMMYPRLHIARNLLKDDGVIFISIDDNEVHHLRLIMDEIFGEENFVAQMPWRKRTAKSDVPFGVSQDFEWILAFAKSESFIAGMSVERKYYSTEDYPNDKWRLSDLTTQKIESQRKNSAFDLVDPKTGKIYKYNPKRLWAITKDTFDDYYSMGKIVFPDDYNFLNITMPAYRVFESEDKAKAIKKYGVEDALKSISTFLPQTIGMSEDGNKQMNSMFESKIFDYPKPTSLISYLADFTQDKEGIVLDFFAGSGTTAHAVMEQNAKDGGNRKYICVQLPEVTDETSEAYKAGYKTIADIARERIRRAGQKVLKDNADKLKDRATPLDIGFKDFAVSPSNFIEIPNGANSQDELLLVDNLKSNATDQDLLTQLRLLQGQTINNQPKTLTFGDLTVFVQGSICYCLQANANIDDLTALLKAGFTKIVLLDRCFKNNQDSTNFEQQYLALDSSIILETY